jgi:hypothetical protein
MYCSFFVTATNHGCVEQVRFGAELKRSGHRSDSARYASANERSGSDREPQWLDSPDLQDEATKLVLQQAELLCHEWAE